MNKEREAIERMKAKQRKEIEAMLENEKRLAAIREKARQKEEKELERAAKRATEQQGKQRQAEERKARDE